MNKEEKQEEINSETIGEDSAKVLIEENRKLKVRVEEMEKRIKEVCDFNRELLARPTQDVIAQPQPQQTKTREELDLEFERELFKGTSIKIK